MKTIYTTLPIYDKIAKQAYERARKGGIDKPKPIHCPLDELPSFQWKDNGDLATSVSEILLIDIEGNAIDITAYFVTLPTLVALTSVSYFVYEGGVLLHAMDCGLKYLQITTDNAKVYYSDWFDVEDTTTDYLKISFTNTCDLGNILYQTGFVQKLWFKSEPMEAIFPMEEEGIKNGKGRVIRTFARQVKKYLVRTNMMPDYMVDVFNRMKLHDTVYMTDLVGDYNEMLNLEVDHEWVNQDKYYAMINLTFDYDEIFIVSGCCNNYI